MAGRLHVVATPIGNLKDLTFRAVEVLKAVQFIVCEDTRHSRKLLDSYGIDTSDLKNQKGSILNVKVSGGKASFGAIVQGAMNNVSGTAGVRKHE